MPDFVVRPALAMIAMGYYKQAGAGTGSSFFGDCSKALIESDQVMKEVWGEKSANAKKQNLLI